MSIVLIGPPGAGKSTLAPMLAADLGLTAVDSDDVFARRHGPIPAFFAAHGEAGFRRAEADIVAELLAGGNRVVSLGGGAPVQPGAAPLLAGHTVVLLDLDADSARQRVGTGAGRPLLRDGLAGWEQLHAERRQQYRQLADVVCDTSGLTVDQVRARLRERLAEPTPPARIEVGGDRPYPVLVGRGLLRRVPEFVPADVHQVYLVHQPVQAERADLIARALADRVRVTVHEIPDAEDGKRLPVAADCWRQLGELAFSRRDLVIGLGGGAATDLAGFVAATWLRGVRVLQLPTSTLAMADAAVGGKTGINTAEGKNLVGSFHTPIAVLCDTGALSTLDRLDVRSGFAEVLKCGLIGAPAILDLFDADPGAVLAPGSQPQQAAIEEAIRLKARVVAADLRESGEREFLNYGHTLGHAIEHAERYRWRHGQAVAAGMIFAARLARDEGLLGDADVDRHLRLVQTLDLPTTYRRDAWPELYAEMLRDKKTRNGVLRFVVLDGIGHPRILPVDDEPRLRRIYEEMSA
jgi:3-dehydroquinate synthase